MILKLSVLKKREASHLELSKTKQVCVAKENLNIFDA